MILKNTVKVDYVINDLITFLNYQKQLDIFIREEERRGKLSPYNLRTLRDEFAVITEFINTKLLKRQRNGRK
jgi:hypothetical protein